MILAPVSQPPFLPHCITALATDVLCYIAVARCPLRNEGSRHFTDSHFVSPLSSSAEAHGEEYRPPGIQEEAVDTQMRQVRQVLPAGDFAEEAPEARVRSGAQAELPDLRQEVHA